MDTSNPLLLALNAIGCKDIAYVDEARVMQRLAVEGLLSALDDMTKEVSRTLSTTRRKAVEAHNDKTHVKLQNFLVGEYIVVARFSKPRTKISANWVGPRRIFEALPD